MQAQGPDPDREDIVMLVRSRLSRIYFLRKFFNYPLKLDFADREEPRPASAGEDRRLVHRRAAAPAAGAFARRLLHQPLRAGALRHLLPRLHREGVGRAVLADRPRVGRTAREGAVGHRRAAARAQEPRLQRRDHRAEGSRDEPDRALPVSEVRPRADVGAGRGQGPGARRHDPDRACGRRADPARRRDHRGPRGRQAQRRAEDPPRRLRVLDDAGARADRRHRADRCPTTCARSRPACSTATS